LNALNPTSGLHHSAQQRWLYDEYGVELPLFHLGLPELRYFRISAHLHNSLADYAYLAEAVRSLIVSLRRSHRADGNEQGQGLRRQRFSGGLRVA